MRNYLGPLFLAGGCFLLSCCHAQTLANPVRAGLYRLLPHDPVRRQELERFDPDARYIAQNKPPVLPFVQPTDDIKFAVIAGGDYPDRKIFFLANRSPKFPPFESTGGVYSPPGSDATFPFDVRCLAFGINPGGEMCKTRDVSVYATPYGPLRISASYDLQYGQPKGVAESAFELIEDKNYIDLVSLSRENKLYGAPDLATEKPNSLPAGTIVSVLSRGPEWLRVDIHQDDGSAISGWLARQNLIEGEWVPQNASDGKHSFRVAYNVYEAGDEEGEAEYSAWSGMEVTSLQSGTVQYIFDVYGEGHLGKPASIINMRDVNFDGYPDLELFAHDGGAGPNYGNAYFIYEPDSDKFVYNERLSEMTQIEFSHQEKTVTTAWRASCCEHGWEKYRWSKGKLIKIAGGGDRYFSDGDLNYVELTAGRLINGRWRERTSKKLVKD